MGPFHTVFSGWVLGICGRLLICHCSVDGRVQRNCGQFPTVEVLYPSTTSWTQCHYLTVCTVGTYELDNTGLWKLILWYQLICQILEMLLAILSGDLLWWECVFAWTWGFTFCDQIYGNFVKRTFWNFCHLERASLNLCFLSAAEGTLSDVFSYVFVHSFPIVLSFY